MEDIQMGCILMGMRKMRWLNINQHLLSGGKFTSPVSIFGTMREMNFLSPEDFQSQVIASTSFSSPMMSQLSFKMTTARHSGSTQARRGCQSQKVRVTQS